MKRERPTTSPKAPTEPTTPGWMSYGGLRAFYGAMEDWHDTMSHWHRDAKRQGIPCYADCPTCDGD